MRSLPNRMVWLLLALGIGQVVLGPREVEAAPPYTSYAVIQVLKNNKPVAGAKVDIRGPVSKWGYTDARGVVKFTNLPEGNYKATGMKPNVGSGSTTFTIKPGQGPATPKLRLQ